jgi:hypothetical protein
MILLLSIREVPLFTGVDSWRQNGLDSKPQKEATRERGMGSERETSKSEEGESSQQRWREGG